MPTGRFLKENGLTKKHRRVDVPSADINDESQAERHCLSAATGHLRNSSPQTKVGSIRVGNNAQKNQTDRWHDET